MIVPLANATFYMQKIGFTESLEKVLKEDPRYDREAYLFLRDALDYTIKLRKRQKSDISRHVTGQELLEGVRRYAIEQFGPMVPTVFEAWNIHESLDVGRMVFNLIRVGIFGKTENDSMDDFRDGFDFHEAFVKPYLPTRRVLVRPAVRPGAKSHRKRAIGNA